MLRRYGLFAALFLASCASISASSDPPAAVSTSPPAAFASLQWLYGSGEGAAASVQAYGALRDYALRQAQTRPANSVVLAADATLASPTFVPCGRRPLAVVLDIDETTLQNLGYQYDRDVRGVGWSKESWNDWEAAAAHVEPMPGALEAIRAIRRANIVIVFNSNRTTANAEQTARALEDAGFEDIESGRTLWLMQQDAGSGKDTRRAEIAARYCVIALAGDQLGDFSDLFGRLTTTPRRGAVQTDPLSALWGNGWFILSNPVYGSGLAGTRDEIFPPPVRWTAPDHSRDSAN